MNLRRVCFFCVIILQTLLSNFGCSPAVAQLPDVDESKADFITVPSSFRQVSGKYPDAHVVLMRSGCVVDSAGKALNQLDDAAYTVILSGSGSQVANVKRDDTCTISFDLKTTSTDHGVVVAKISRSGGIPLTAFLHFSDPVAGPTPGIPEVDVMWAPISYEVCDKAFGRSVAKRFYCIAVKIGNNSGYQLQIAGLGFKTLFGPAGKPYSITTPNSSYALTRAVAQGGSTESTRAYVLSSIEATGLLMASAAPYFHNARSSSRYGVATSIVAGPLQAAFNILWPDPSLRHANNLDDQSLREGRLIPNNTPITTVVFVDKGSVLLDYKSACDNLFGTYQDIDGTAYSKMQAHQVAEDINKKNGNAGALYTKCLKENSSSALRAALGDIVLVGDKIQYLERIVVDQSSHPAQSDTVQPQVTTVDLDYKIFTITGTNLDKLPALQATSTAYNDPGKTLSQDLTLDPKSTSTSANYTLPNPFNTGSAFSIAPKSGILPFALAGIVKNSATVTISSAPILTGKSLTFSGTNLDLLPAELTVMVAGKSPTATRDSTSSASKASYTIEDQSSSKGTEFSLKPVPNVKISGPTAGKIT